MNLHLAEQLADMTFAAAAERKAAALAVAILDVGGNVVLIKRQDGAGLLRVDIAVGKAKGALGMGHGTRALAKMAEAAPAFFAGAMAATGAILPSPGGIILRDAEQQLIGAIGVSGDRGDVDEACAIVAIEKLSLHPSL